MNKNDILDKAKTIINGERQGTYGHAEDSFGVIAKLWSAFLGKELSSADVANMMILMKVARNSSGVYKDDNWVDICGYAALGGEIQDSSNKTGSTGVFHLEEVRFPTGELAMEAFNEMNTLISKYGRVTVADYYDIAGVSYQIKCTFAPITAYGWKSLDNATTRWIKNIDNYYVIDLPEPQKL